MKDLVSIVVPIYNVENYLERCINSLLIQTYTNIQIILVNDGSTDTSGILCENFKKKDNRIEVIHKKNGGLSDARNCGIRAACGKYIMFIDSDDWIESDMVYQLYMSIKENNSQIAISNRYRAYENKEKIKETYRNYPSKTSFSNIDGLKYLLTFSGFDMSVCDKMFLLELFKDIKFPFGKTCEDSFTMYKLFDKATQISYILNPLYNYFYRENSITRNYNVNETVIEAAKEQFNFIKNNYTELLNEASAFLISAYMSVYNEYINRCKKCEKITIFKKEAKKYLLNALKCENITILKKFQMIIFCISSWFYKLIYNFMKINKNIIK